MGRRQTGNIEKAGGFLFRWDGVDHQGYHFGTVWRDNTEQDFQGLPEAFISETKLSRLRPEWANQVNIRGSESSDEMAMPSLDVAAGYVWGFHAGYRDGVHGGVTPEQPNVVLVEWEKGEGGPHAACVRCDRDVPRRFLAKLIERQGGGLACSPLDPENQAECQRIVEAREERL
ncbi:hypothetical protein [Streptomyces cyaneofuscatus]|uniref:hypothetical protein n=1 Tax=Streptomyces cyaneofuscatus TaxID=66883 RepID=UPI003627BA69